MQKISDLLGFGGVLSYGNIALGILSEMLIYKDLTDYLYSNLQNKKMIDKNFKYNLVIGDYDQGFDFIKNDVEIDVKHYSTHIFSALNEILRYNLFVDERQFNNHKADIYIQSFTLMEENQPFIIVARYQTKDKLTYNSKLPKPAYCCSVEKLLTYENLKLNYFK